MWTGPIPLLSCALTLQQLRAWQREGSCALLGGLSRAMLGSACPGRPVGTSREVPQIPEWRSCVPCSVPEALLPGSLPSEFGSKALDARGSHPRSARTDVREPGEWGTEEERSLSREVSPGSQELGVRCAAWDLCGVLRGWRHGAAWSQRTERKCGRIPVVFPRQLALEGEV